MPQLDHYNFTLPYFCFAIGFLFTIVMLATVYLPMLFKHQKVREFHLKEMIAINKILEKERLLLISAREQSMVNAIKTKFKH